MDLTIKYRPKTLSALCGNESAKDFVKSLFKNKTFPACTIIYGTNGVGKSSLAYILSRMFSCENLKNDITPCGVCSKCQAMDKMYQTGDTVNGLNIFKYDIGLKTSSEYINQIVTSIKRPTTRHKLIHIDELQLLSFNEQEKLNNPIEFCNDKTHIIITTTNLNGICKSIKSRSTIITLNKPTVEEQVNLADYILTMEGKKGILTKGELKILAEISETPRMLVKNLQDIISVGKDRYTQITITAGKDISEYVKYFESIGGGVVDLVLYIEALKEPTNFLNGLPTFIYNCICSRYGTTYYKGSAIKDILIYNDSNLVEVIKLLSQFNSKGESSSKQMLLTIGFELNKSIIPTVNKTDDVNTLHHVPVEQNKTEEHLNNILVTNFGTSTIKRGDL